MSNANTTGARFRWLAGLAVLGLAVVLMGQTRFAASEPATHAGDSQDQLWIEYLEACVRLAESDLALAELTNNHVRGAVTEYDMARLRLRRAFVEHARSQLNQGRDYGDIFADHAELHARLAELDVKSAEVARRAKPDAISDAQLERLRRNAEMYRLKAKLARHSEQKTDIVDHLHTETHRLAVELIQLNRRVDELEEIVNR